MAGSANKTCLILDGKYKIGELFHLKYLGFVDENRYLIMADKSDSVLVENTAQVYGLDFDKMTIGQCFLLQVNKPNFEIMTRDYEDGMFAVGGEEGMFKYVQYTGTKVINSQQNEMIKRVRARYPWS